MHTRKLFALLGALALTFSVATTALVTKPSPHQVTICHRTDSNTNPYVIETVDIASSGLLRGGHNDHTGPVWNPTLKAAHIKWGDIIPPYTYGTFVYPGMNYAEGLAIYEAGCTIPSEPAHNPAIHIVKTPSVTTLPAGGGDVTYTYVVTNTGARATLDDLRLRQQVLRGRVRQRRYERRRRARSHRDVDVHLHGHPLRNNHQYRDRDRPLRRYDRNGHG